MHLSVRVSVRVCVCVCVCVFVCLCVCVYVSAPACLRLFYVHTCMPRHAYAFVPLRVQTCDFFDARIRVQGRRAVIMRLQLIS